MSLPVYHEAVKQFKPKVYTEMARVAVRNGQAPALRVWSALRAMDRTGCGIVGKRELRAFQRAFAVSDADLRYADAISAGVFFQISTHYIEYRSLEHVCVALGVKPGRVHTIELADLRTVQRFKASCYAAWLSGDEPKNISRTKLCELWNHSENTLRNWERAQRIDVTYNAIDVTDHVGTIFSPGVAYSAPIPRDDRPEREGYIPMWRNREGRVFVRTVNSYMGHRPEAPRGMARRVNRSVNAAWGLVSGKAIEQVFYTPTELNHALMKRGTCYVDGDTIISTSRSLYSVWNFSTMRPVNAGRMS